MVASYLGKKICNKYQVPVIALHDIDKKNGHPTIKGMKSIADQVLKVIKSKEIIRFK